MGFHFFARRAVPSHAYVHLVDVGQPVTIGGLTINTGDILHGDQHGVTRIPIEIAGEIPGAAERVEDREKKIINYCRSDGFSVDGLRNLLTKV